MTLSRALAYCVLPFVLLNVSGADSSYIGQDGDVKYQLQNNLKISH